MQTSQSVKSKIYKVLVTKDNVTKDYPVQAYEDTINYALTLVAKKLDVDFADISIANSRYNMQFLQYLWKNPNELLVRERETIEPDSFDYKLGERAQSDLNALLKYESPKTISEGNLYVVKDVNGRRTETTEIRFRPFYTTIGILNNKPMHVKASENVRVRANRAFVTDTNDMIYDSEDTILMPNTDYIFPISVKGKKDSASLNSVFRFSSSEEAYLYVRDLIVTSGIADLPYRQNRQMTYLEACDSWLVGTGVKMGRRDANPQVLEKHLNEIMKTKSEHDGRKLKYPKLK